MERKFKRSESNKPLGEFGDRDTKNKDFDLTSDTLNDKQEEKNKKTKK